MSISFQTLWTHHPVSANEADDTPCDDSFANQCAIRMGVAFEKSGVSMASFGGVRCWFHDKEENHVLRAEEFAKWLDSPFSPLKKVKKGKSEKVIDQIKSKKGVIFFKNFWGAGNQGDHIDLWNGSRMADPNSAGRASSYAARAKEVWFWPLNN